MLAPLPKPMPEYEFALSSSTSVRSPVPASRAKVEIRFASVPYDELAVGTHDQAPDAVEPDDAAGAVHLSAAIREQAGRSSRV